jgi:hypothetical protein
MQEFILFGRPLIGLVSKVNNKSLDVPQMWQNERLQLKSDYKCCRMITNTLNMIKITK